MLALMAGRNGGEALVHVRNGEVEYPVLPREWTIASAEPVYLVAEHIMVSL